MLFFCKAFLAGGRLQKMRQMSVANKYIRVLNGNYVKSKPPFKRVVLNSHKNTPSMKLCNLNTYIILEGAFLRLTL